MDLKDDGRIEQYGFAAVPETSIPIYSANLAFLSGDAQLSGVAPDFLEHALVVYIDARPHIRSARLAERSPDIIKGKPDEAAMRLAGDKEGIFKQAHVYLRTRNVANERPLYEDTIRIILQNISRTKLTT